MDVLKRRCRSDKGMAPSVKKRGDAEVNKSAFFIFDSSRIRHETDSLTWILSVVVGRTAKVIFASLLES